MSTIDQGASARLASRNEEAFAEAERQGLMLAARVRTVALLIILVLAAIDNPAIGPAYFYDLAEIAIFVVLGLLQFICARQRIHMKTLKYVFVLLDCGFLAFVFSAPNLYDTYSYPPAIAMNGSQFTYFFILLMQASFSLLPSLVVWCGVCIATSRALMLVWFTSQPGVYTNLALSDQSVEALVQARSDPNFLFIGFVATEILVVLMVATGLALVVKRSRLLLESRSLAERSRASLARYFSPNVVDRLSNSDAPLATVREQDVAVLFADIVGFTKMCEHKPAIKVIRLLRDYHDRLGRAVFNNNGTLDKYMGDGLMATFGTPDPGPRDAANALQCAMDMIAALEDWNIERTGAGRAPVHVGIGLHHGPVIAGDIGNERRLEYSVIGDTVNIASRLERMTRDLNTKLVVSDGLIQAIDRNTPQGKAFMQKLSGPRVQEIRGRGTSIAVWTLRDPLLA